MCGIVGFIPKVESEAARKLFLFLLYESQIRGMHATGFSYLDENRKVHTFKRPVPAVEFIQLPDFAKAVFDPKNKAFIAHTRYATSGDFKNNNNNQPIQIGDCAVVHNGVITQDPPETWKAKYCVDPFTGNDSELLLTSTARATAEDSGSSISALYLTGKQIYALTNGLRPMWHAEYQGCTFIFSTADIWKRSFKHLNANDFVAPNPLVTSSFSV